MNRSEALTWVKQDQTIRSDKVDPTSTGFRTEKEDEFFPIRVIELVDELLSFRDVHRAIESEVWISKIMSGERYVGKARKRTSCSLGASRRDPMSAYSY